MMGEMMITDGGAAAAAAVDDENIINKILFLFLIMWEDENVVK